MIRTICLCAGLLLIALCLLGKLAAQAEAQPAMTAPPASVAPSGTLPNGSNEPAATESPILKHPTDRTARIGTGDLLRIAVLRCTPYLTTETRVSGAGTIRCR